MKPKLILTLILAALLITACSGVEMVPAPQPTPVPSLPPASAQPPAAAATQPAGQPTTGGVIAFDETPGPVVDQPIPLPPQAGLSLLATVQPQPGDEKMEESKAFLDEAKIVDLQTAPSGKGLFLSGNLPTPCHQLRARFEGPDGSKRVRVSVYSVVMAELTCAQVLEPFELTLPMPSYAAGSYSVEVNGEKAGDLTIP